jgi:CHASE2 domain-containing sensor protein
LSLLSLLLELLLTLFVVRQLLIWLGRRLLVFFHWLRKTKLISTIIKVWNSLPGLPQRIFSYLAQVWHHLSHFSRNLIINLIIGLSLTWVLLTFFHDLPWLREPEDEGMDLVMQLTQGIIPPIQDENLKPFVFLDIDDETHQKWGEPMFTPRNYVKNLIAAAVQARARLVIVDIDLSRKTPIDGLGLSRELHPYDQELYDYLKNYPMSCPAKANPEKCPPIILFRRLSDKPNYTLNFWKQLTDKIPPPPILKPSESFLDEAVKSSTYVQWASALFIYSSDQVVRRWWLWQCIPEEPKVIPSIELLAAAFIKNNISQPELIRSLHESLDKTENCPQDDQPYQTGEPIKIGELTIHPDTLIGNRQRIIYKQLRGKQQPSGFYEEVKDRHGKTFSISYPAWGYAQSNADLDNLKDRVVIIGGSYNDIHLTPLGKIPGALNVMNAIYSLLQYGEIHSLTFWQKICVQAGLIFLTCLLSFGFVRITIKWLQLSPNVLCFFSLVTSLFVILLMLPISALLLHYYGIWLDFVIPLILIQLNQTIATFNNLFEPK